MPDIELTTDGAVSLAPGDRLVLRLAENPTTGYRWELPEPPAALSVESDEFRPSPSEAPGSGGERVIVLRATAAGQQSVRLRLKRPWESAAIRTLTADVTVRPAGEGPG